MLMADGWQTYRVEATRCKYGGSQSCGVRRRLGLPPLFEQAASVDGNGDERQDDGQADGHEDDRGPASGFAAQGAMNGKQHGGISKSDWRPELYSGWRSCEPGWASTTFEPTKCSLK